MNISRENGAEKQTILLTISITPEDYKDKVEEQLHNYRRQVLVPGFRPGMAPLGMVQKMFGQKFKAQAIMDLVNNGVSAYMKDNRLEVIGEPMPVDTKPLDMEKQDSFSMTYEMAISPEINLQFDSSIQVPHYTITGIDAEVDELADGYLRYFGTQEDSETAGMDDLLTVALTQDKEEGHSVNDTKVSLKYVSEEARQQLLGKRVGDSVAVNVRQMLTSDVDCAAFLNVKTEELNSLDPNFVLTIVDIKHREPAKIGQEFFDRAFGEGVVKSEEEFRSRLVAEVQQRLAEECEYRFEVDMRRELIRKANVELPHNFMKRWLISTMSEKPTDEEMENSMPSLLDEIRWELIEAAGLKHHGIEVQEEDLLETAKMLARQQYAMYGYALPDNLLTEQAQKQLAKPERRKKISGQTKSRLFARCMRSSATIVEKSIDLAEFRKLS